MPYYPVFHVFRYNNQPQKRIGSSFFISTLRTSHSQRGNKSHYCSPVKCVPLFMLLWFGGETKVTKKSLRIIWKKRILFVSLW